MKMMQQGASASHSPVCKVANFQARTMDKIELRNQFTNVPEVVKEWEQRLTTISKAYLWPFVRNVELNNVSPTSNTFATTVTMKFQKRVPAFDLTVERPNEKLFVKGIGIPYPFNLVVPLKAGTMHN